MGATRDDVGIDTDGVGQPDTPLAARGGCDRLDRQLVLFHSPRPQPQAGPRTTGRRLRRGVAGPRRRLLPDHEVPGGAGQNAGRTDLVQMGGLYHLAVRLLSLIHISEPTRLGMISYAVFC